MTEAVENTQNTEAIENLEPTALETPPAETPSEESTPDKSQEALADEGKKESLEIEDITTESGEKKKEIPKWVDKKLSKKEREIEQLRAQLAQAQGNGQQIPNSNTLIDPQAPKREDFANEADYIAAAARYGWEKDMRTQQQQASRQAQIQAQQKFRENWENLKETTSEKYSDFEEISKVLDSPDIPTNLALCQALIDSPYGDDIIYFLARNKDEAKKIASLDPIKAVKRVAELEARLEAKKKSNISKTPKPLEPVNSQNVGNRLMDIAQIAEKGSQKDFEIAMAKRLAERRKSHAF